MAKLTDQIIKPKRKKTTVAKLAMKINPKATISIEVRWGTGFSVDPHSRGRAYLRVGYKGGDYRDYDLEPRLQQALVTLCATHQDIGSRRRARLIRESLGIRDKGLGMIF